MEFNRNRCPFFSTSDIINFGKICTTFKGRNTDACQAFGKNNAHKPCAVRENIIAKRGDTFGNDDGRKIGATRKGRSTNFGYTVGN